MAGLFGSVRKAAGGFNKVDPESNLSWADRLAAIGGVLQGDTGAASELRQLAASRGKLALQRSQQAELLAGLGLAPGVEAGNPAAPSAPVAPLTIPPLISAAGAHPAPAAPRGRGLTSMADAAPILARAILSGTPGADKLVEVLNAAKPSLDIAPDGTAFDKSDRSNVGKAFPKLGEGMLNGPGGVALAPGYAGALRTSTGAQEAGKADYDLVDVPLPNGRQVKMPRGQYIQLRESGAFPQLGVTQAPGERAFDEAAGRGAGSAESDIIDVPMSDGSSVKMSRGQFQRSQGIGGGASGLRIPAPPAARIGVSQTPGDKQYSTATAGDSAARFKGYQDRGGTAQARIGQFDQLEGLLGGFEGGKLAETGVEIASTLNSLGFKVDPKLGNKQAAKALGSQMLLTSLGGSLGPGVSNSDVAFLKETIPGLGQSADGRRKMIDYGKRVAQRDLQVSEFARKWQQNYGRIDAPDAKGRSFEDSLRVWSAKNRLFGQ